MEERLRLFIAIDLPSAIHEALGSEINRLALVAPEKVVRWVRPDSIHLTLKFLGDTQSGRTDEIVAVMAEAVKGLKPFSIVVGGLGLFPNLRQPRVIWAGLQEPTGRLAVLQKRIEGGALGLGYKPEQRGYEPHLTLGRVAREAGPRDRRRLGEILAAETVSTLGEVPVSGLTLFRSELNRGGAVYTRLAQAPLST